MRSHGNPGARLWFGLIVLGLGVLWTLDNMGVLDAGQFTRFWPFALILYGSMRILGFGMRRRPVGGFIWLMIGGWFALRKFDLVSWDFDDVWPLFLILLGGLLVWRSLRGPRSWRSGVEVHVLGAERRADAGGPVDAESFSCVAVWSGVDRKSTSQALKGGDFTAVMGGGELDLRAARPVPEGAVLEMVVIMGGLEIFVPEDWTVVNEATAVMGAIEDSRKVGVPAGPNTLVLKGFVMMGGVELKN